jgi:hypothetical protein
MLFEEAAAARDRPLSDADYWWLKSIAAGVGGDDPWLIGAVADSEPRDREDVRRILAAHPLSLKIPQDFQFEGEFLYPGISPARSAPPERPGDKALWASGLLSPNRYSLYHPALLAGSGKLLDSFLSRGKRDVLFPLVDQVHGAIIHWLEAGLGHGCLDHYIPDECQREAALREIGTLCKAMYDSIHPESYGLRQLVKDLRDLAKRWKGIRNSAAHFLDLDYRDWVAAVDQYGRARESLFAGPGAYARMGAV